MVIFFPPVVGHAEHVPGPHRRRNGQMASNRPAGWMRRIGRAASVWAGSTTQACDDCGKKRPHRQDPPPGIVHLVRPQQLEGVLVLALNQLMNTLQRNRRSHTHLLAKPFQEPVLVLRAAKPRRAARDGKLSAGRNSWIRRPRPTCAGDPTATRTVNGGNPPVPAATDYPHCIF